MSDAINELDTPERQRKKTRARFGLKSLLLLVLFVAVSFGAFQLGHQIGFKQGDRSGFAAGLIAKSYPVSYRVADFVLPGQKTNALASLDELAAEITQNVQPTTWEKAGGPGTIVPYTPQLTLVVLQTERGHEEIGTYLEAKRAARGPIVDRQTATAQPSP